MKLKHVLKATCAAVALATAGAAFGSPIYLDVGTNFAPGSDKVTPTSTSVKNEVLYAYQSTTVVTDTNGNGIIDAGDAITTSIGLFGTNTLSSNMATGFNPNQAFGTNANNGYGTNWLLSFRSTDLTGVIAGVTAGGVPLLAYSGGTVEMLLTFDGISFNNFMNLDVTGGGADGVATVLFGGIDFTGTDAGFNNLFHAANGVNCAGNTGFYDLATCSPFPATLSFAASQDTNVLISSFTNNGDGTFTVSTNHDGSVAFNVPEPSALLLAGSALLGLGFSGRRRRTETKV